MIHVNSRQNVRIPLYRNLARRRRAGDESLLLDGRHLVRDAHGAGVPITSAAFSKDALGDEALARFALELEESGTDVFSVPRSLMDVISPVRSPSDVVAIARHTALPLARLFERTPQLVLVAVGVQDAGNVGAIVRSAEAGGATGVVFTNGCADPFGWKALRGAMGSTFRLDVVGPVALADVVATARARGVVIVATTPRSGRSLYDTDLAGAVAFLLGGEGPGLEPEAVTGADERLSIPMQPPVESLNVAVAAALLVYEAARQRRKQD